MQADALWVTSWPFPEYVDHAWPNAWDCSWFRNESAQLSSELIQQAVAATRWYWGPSPSQGLITMVNPDKIASPNPGYCFLKAGWHRLKERTKSGLIVYQLLPSDMPDPEPYCGATLRLF